MTLQFFMCELRRHCRINSSCTEMVVPCIARGQTDVVALKSPQLINKSRAATIDCMAYLAGTLKSAIHQATSGRRTSSTVNLETRTCLECSTLLRNRHSWSFLFRVLTMSVSDLIHRVALAGYYLPLQHEGSLDRLSISTMIL